jgi:hypothetical protein
MQREVRQVSGWFLALLALVVQLTLAAAVPATTVALADITTLCHHDGNPSAPKAPAHQIPDCQLCIVCHAATGPAGLLTAAPMLPLPMTIPIARAVVLPPATAPPLRFVTAARPRGPPIPV